MSEGAIFINSGPLFKDEHLHSLEENPDWSSSEDDVRVAYQMIREAFEKHATLLAGNPSVDETRYFMVTPTLHALGFMATADERAGNNVRVDYALFDDSDSFSDSEPMRGSAGFFRPAVGIVQCVKWGSELDAIPEDAEEGSVSPGQKLDVLLRTTGADYGILTNGCDWRIYHRLNSALQDTWFQADMIAAVKSDFEDFKQFYFLFRANAFTKDDSGEGFLDRILQ